jgi:hypothetical protein
VLLCAVAMISRSSASSADEPASEILAEPASGFAEPIGKVGVLPFSANRHVPRAAGMVAHLSGCVVSHPALKVPLTVSRNGADVPILGFTITIALTNTAGVAGLEVVRGKGKLRIFYHPDGIRTVSDDMETGEEIEVDEVRFLGELDFSTGNYFIRLREAALTTKPFKLAGKTLQTPVGRQAMDIMFGEFAPDLRALAVVSSVALHSQTPAGRLMAFAPRHEF